LLLWREIAPGGGRTRRSPACGGRSATNNNYEQTGLIFSLNYFANNRVYFLRNFYDKSKRSVLKPKVEGPAAYVLPANDPVSARRPRCSACCRSRVWRFHARRRPSP